MQQSAEPVQVPASAEHASHVEPAQTPLQQSVKDAQAFPPVTHSPATQRSAPLQERLPVHAASHWQDSATQDSPEAHTAPPQKPPSGMLLPLVLPPLVPMLLVLLLPELAATLALLVLSAVLPLLVLRVGPLLLELGAVLPLLVPPVVPELVAVEASLLPLLAVRLVLPPVLPVAADAVMLAVDVTRAVVPPLVELAGPALHPANTITAITPQPALILRPSCWSEQVYQMVLSPCLIRLQRSAGVAGLACREPSSGATCTQANGCSR